MECDYLGCDREAAVYSMCEEHAPDSWKSDGCEDADGGLD